MGNIPNSMSYELRQFVKSLAATTKVVTADVKAVQDEKLIKAVAKEIEQEDPPEAEQIVEDAINGKQKNRVHKKNSEESRGEV